MQIFTNMEVMTPRHHPSSASPWGYLGQQPWPPPQLQQESRGMALNIKGGPHNINPKGVLTALGNTHGPYLGIEGGVSLQREDTLLINPAGDVTDLEDPTRPIGPKANPRTAGPKGARTGPKGPACVNSTRPLPVPHLLHASARASSSSTAAAATGRLGDHLPPRRNGTPPPSA
ncbi:hypothetical protein SETIT_9G239200v2 [Setaria italica]|uniref:Uncharacterized protein n=1 Tax=Setaria italica TaxID=4555 RepID=A0A368SK07_SETIT|nr:hypothetical protein SETIT_9G239200v2 [Setaria italica]